MVTRVCINDNKKSPLGYLHELKNFKNGTEYIFKPGINIIVGENGSGKSTLLNLIKSYLMVGYKECERGLYNCNINNLFKSILDRKLLNGIDVYADYDKNTFRLSHPGEMDGQTAMERGFQDFGIHFAQKHVSTGEGVSVAMIDLFNYMFSENAKLKFDYNEQFKELYPEYVEYCNSHRKENCENEFTILMDEPDRNLSIDKIKDLKGVLGYHKEHTQIIAVIHNPALIYWLAKRTDAHFIEMSPNYVNKVITFIDDMTI